MSDETLPALAQAAIKYWWLFLIQGLIALAIGALLVFKTGKSVEFVAIVLGLYVIFWGAVQIVGAFVVGENRLINVVVGVAAIAVGGLIVGNPDRTARLIAVAVGIYLIVWGIVAVLGLLGERPDKTPRAFGGLLAAIAGIIVVSLPGKSVEFVAIVFGIYLIVTALVEIVSSLRLRRLADA